MISPKLVTIPKTADGQLKFIGGDQVLRTSTSMGQAYHPSSRRSSRRPSWRIRRVSTNHQSKKSLHINTVYTEISHILTKIASKNIWETCHELLQQADLRRLLQVKQVAIMVPGLSTSSSSSLPSSTSMTLSRQEIDHPTSSSSSSTSPTMTSSTVSSDSVARQERWDLCGIDSYPVTVSSKHVES